MFKIDTTKLIEEQIKHERDWRDSALIVADIELNKVQDGVGVGTVTAWRTYRCELRGWPAHAMFPDSAYRPVSPDAK